MVSRRVLGSGLVISALSFGLTGSAGFAVTAENDIKKPEFEFWDEGEVAKHLGDSAPDLAMKIPESNIALQLSQLGIYLTEEIKNSGSLNEVDQIPTVARLQQSYFKMMAAAKLSGDFSAHSLNAAKTVVEAYRGKKSFFQALMSVENIKFLALKMYRLQIELESRVDPWVMEEGFED